MGEIIDAHHHLWTFSETEYGWIDESMEMLKRDFMPSDLIQTINSAGIAGTVAVQARQTLEETLCRADAGDSGRRGMAAACGERTAPSFA
jgi:predicted TIM-barrel fold metal-dependent hydrolase